MENSSIFWNKIAEWLTSLGFSYVSVFETKLIVLTAFLVLLFILWLILRKIRLWYWKTNIQIDTLKSIEVHLHHVEEKLSQASVRIVETAGSTALQSDGVEQTSETEIEEEEPERAGLTAVGKSGRIYTEAELELQIRE